MSSEDRLRQETAPLLAERVRIGFGLMIAGLCGFAIADAHVHPELLQPLLAIAAAQIAVTVVGLWNVRGTPTFEHSVRTALVVLGNLCVTGALSDVLSANLYGTPINSLAIAIIAATFIPWGGGPQAAFVAIAGTGALGATYAIRGQVVDISHLLAGAATVHVASILLASSGARVRRQQFEAESALAAARARAEEEAEVASLLVEVGQALSAALGAGDLLKTVTAFAHRAIQSDTVLVWVLDPQRETFYLASAVGLPDDLHTTLRELEFAPTSVPLLEELQRGRLVDIPDFRDQVLVPVELPTHFGTTSSLLAPIVSRGSLQGVLCFGQRGQYGPATARTRRLATGIAQATTVALENAQLVTDLEAASRLKSDFVATMSHELRTPLNVILGYSELLVDEGFGTLTAAQADLVRRIDRSAKELFDLVSSTLDLGRLEAGRNPVQRAPVDLAAMVAALAPDVEPLVQPGVALLWACDDLPKTVSSDGAKLRTILKNLVGNALKFTSAGSVRVHLGWADEELLMTVTDTGIGIAAAQVPVIFEMFRQVDGSATREFGGVGLGLHIVHRLCGLLGGTVQVESEPGVGSSFRVRLPASACAADASRAA